MIKKPLNEEYPDYYHAYISMVSEGSLKEILINQLKELTVLLSDVQETQANYRYADGKWTLKEVVGHMMDTERIMSYRLLRIARGDKTPLAGFNEELFVEGASFHTRSLSDLIEEFIGVRHSTVALVRGLAEEDWSRSGFANDTEITVRAIAYIIAGHELHHAKIIKEKYLV
ncbi:MAG: DinB family protein [Paenisporosarcina sp.]